MNDALTLKFLSLSVTAIHSVLPGLTLELPIIQETIKKSNLSDSQTPA
jgi:hypothetical protein